MSILLEALRKSEKQRHLGHAPSIHSTADLETRRPARWKPGVISLVLLPVILVLAWFGVQQYRNVDNPEPARGGVEAEPAAAVSLREPEQLQELKPAVSRQPSIDKERGAYRTPVESLDRGGRATADGPRADEPAEHIQAPGPVASAEFENTKLLPGDSRVLQEPERPPGIVAGQNESEAGQEPGTDSYRSPEYSVITYWRLPESIREQIPVPRLSVLVFSERPEDRFILMNGSRLSEGDEPQPGLVLEEIRRDGAIFSFRLYRFLVSS